jgi:hypothetical protein
VLKSGLTAKRSESGRDPYGRVGEVCDGAFDPGRGYPAVCIREHQDIACGRVHAGDDGVRLSGRQFSLRPYLNKTQMLQMFCKSFDNLCGPVGGAVVDDYYLQELDRVGESGQ